MHNVAGNTDGVAHKAEFNQPAFILAVDPSLILVVDSNRLAKISYQEVVEQNPQKHLSSVVPPPSTNNAHAESPLSKDPISQIKIAHSEKITEQNKKIEENKNGTFLGKMESNNNATTLEIPSNSILKTF